MNKRNTVFFASSNELIKISVKDLKVGMYVAKLDKPWLETTFLYQGFGLKNQADINAVCEQCSFVFIVAEHDETSKHLSFARSIGCNAWQGFWSRECELVSL
jgi:hypothetical protein